MNLRENIKKELGLITEQTTNYWSVHSEKCNTSAMGPYQCINFPAGVTPQDGDIYLTPTGWSASGGGPPGVHDNQTMFIFMVINQGCTPPGNAPTSVVSIANSSSCPRCCTQGYWHINMGAVPGGACWIACGNPPPPPPPPPFNPKECCKWCQSGPPYTGTPPQGCEDWMCTDFNWIMDNCCHKKL